MSENLFETQYDLTKKSKIREFYKSNKILIYLIIFFLIISIGSFSYYQMSKENKKILLSEKYVQAKVYLENGKNYHRSVPWEIEKDLGSYFKDYKQQRGK